MTYALVVRPSVTSEAERIYVYREGEKKGAGEAFADALAAAYARIQANPYGFQVRKGEYRHVMLSGLKYRVVFRVKGALVFVVQVRHTSRRPSKKFGP
jgi:plasmid stabilization system protein ParE